MKGVFVVILCILIALPSLVYAESLDIGVYTETESGKSFGKINAVPGELITAFVEIENKNQDRSNEDEDIEDIIVTVVIEEIDEDEDIEEEFDSFDLRPRKNKDLSFSFEVPLRVRNDGYTIRVEVEASENGEDITQSEDFLVKVNKEKHNPYFTRLEFNPIGINCNEVSYLDMELYNLGTGNENIEMKVKNNEIEFSLQRSFLLESYPDEDIYRNRIPIKIPAGTPTGKYIFELTLNYDNGNLVLKKDVPLDVLCGEEKTSNGKDMIIENKGNGDTTSTDTVASQTFSKSSQTVIENDNSSLVILLTLIILIIVALITIISLKKK